MFLEDAKEQCEHDGCRSCSNYPYKVSRNASDCRSVGIEGELSSLLAASINVSIGELPKPT
jgi:hypothetical protein